MAHNIMDMACFFHVRLRSLGAMVRGALMPEGSDFGPLTSAAMPQQQPNAGLMLAAPFGTR
jgi:hypothetical protein